LSLGEKATWDGKRRRVLTGSAVRRRLDCAGDIGIFCAADVDVDNVFAVRWTYKFSIVEVGDGE